MKHYVQLFIHALALLLLSGLAVVHADTISRYTRFTGNYDYVVTGGSLRNSSSNECSLATSSSQTLSSIPSGATVAAAYLYWGGSGTTTDSTVTLNSSSVTADETFSTTYSTRTFFGGFADVTSLVSGNGTMTFSGLSVTTTGDYCTTTTVVAGWALVVVYEDSSEPLRALNIFHGLDYFRNSSVTLTPDGFRIPSSDIDGKFTAITWEGETDLGGSSEVLNFNGNTLETEGYDSVSYFEAGGTGTTTYGADIDTYDVSSYLSAGDTSATTYYSAGTDFVLLTAQIISATSEPEVDLSIDMSSSSTFTVGSNASYTLSVANATGVQAVDYLTTVTDTLPTGLTYVSATGTDWTCGVSGQVVTCTHAAPLAAGSSFPDITLTVLVESEAYDSVTNTATVETAGSNDYTTSNNTATLTSSVAGSDLSTSTKTVSDINGGEADAGDTLRYTITLIETAGIEATDVSVTDSLPGNTENLTVVSYPSGATDNSTTSLLDISDITVPANGSVTIVFDVTVIATTSPGATISNTATVTNPGGAGATPSSSDVEVSPSQVAGSGIKQLYLWNNTTYAQKLYRTPPSGTHSSVTISGGGSSTTWISTPVLQKAVTLESGSYSVYLVMARSGGTGGKGATTTRNVQVALTNSSYGSLGSAVTQTITNMSTSNTLYTFTLSLSSSVTLPAGSTLTLTVTNTTSNSANTVTVVPYSGSNYSRVELNSATVINVDSVTTYSATYSSTVTASSFVRGSTAYIRAVVSDPFGSFDISAATISLVNPSSTTIVSSASMTEVYDSGGATKIYQYAYTIPSTAVAGIWTARVTANEGTEGTITDLGVGTFTVTVPLPTLSVTKVSSVVSDPINGTTNPKRIPGSVVLYTITVTNSGTGTVDSSTLVLTDAIPTNTTLCLNSTCGGGITFADGSVSSGLSLSSSGVAYSVASGGGTPYTYTPSADSSGYDSTVTGIQVTPTGSMNGVVTTGSNPSFSISFRIKIN